MAATDARPVPRKNAAFRLYFAIRKPSDGTLITSWTGADSEVSLDGAAFSDCTNEATEIGTSGCGYIDLTSSEMNADSVIYKLTVTNTGAVPLVVTLFPEEASDYRVDVTHFGGTAGTFASGRPEVNTTHAAGTAWGSGAITAASIASGAITAAKFGAGAIDATAIADGAIDANTFAAGAITAAAIAADAIGASELAADAVAEIADAVWDEARAGHVSAGTFGEGVASVQGNVTGSVASVSGAVGSVTGNVGGNVTGSVGSVAAGGITAASIATGAIDADALATDAVAEIADGVWDEAIAGHLTGGSTGNALNSAGSAGDPWSTGLPGAYSAGSAGYILGTYLTAAPPTSGAIADAVWDEALSGHQSAGSAGAYVIDINAALVSRSGGTVNDVAATTTSFKTTLTEVDDYYNDALIVFTSGALIGQARTILDFANTNGVITLEEALTSAPANGVSFIIKSDHIHPASQIASAVRTELATELARIDVATSTRLASASYTAPLDAAGTRSAVGLASANLDTQLSAIVADTNELQTDWANGGRLDLIVDAILDDTGTSGVVVANGAITASAIATGAIDADALAADAVSEIWTTALTESYGTDGSTLTGAQLLYLILGHVGEFVISGTSKTLKKLDGSTTAATYTLNDGSTPTGITRAS